MGEWKRKKGINERVRGGMDGWREGGGFVLSLCDCSANRPWAVIMWAIWSCQISKLYCLLIDGLNTPTVSSVHTHTHTQNLKCMHTHTHTFWILIGKPALEEQRWGLWCSDKGCNFNFTPCHSPQYLLRWNTYELPITHTYTLIIGLSITSTHANFHLLFLSLEVTHKDFLLYRTLTCTKLFPFFLRQQLLNTREWDASILCVLQELSRCGWELVCLCVCGNL